MSSRRICMIIGHLNPGGAENQLVNLVRGIDPIRWEVLVVCTHEKGLLSERLEGLPHARVISLARSSKNALKFLSDFHKVLKDFQPQIVHGYLISAHFYTLIMRLIYPAPILVLGIRSSYVDVHHYGLRTRLLYKTVALLSRLADTFIVNSQAGVEHYSQMGYEPRKMRVVSNGIDTELFAPNAQDQNYVKKALDLPESTLLVGIIAMVEHMKDYGTFIRAAARIAKIRTDVHWISVGRCDQPLGIQMRKLVQEEGLTGRFHFLGARGDVRRVLNGLDLVCSSSIGEGFSNSIAEAMSASVPCVVTQVGDSAQIVGDTGVVVPSRDAEKMAEGMLKILSLPESKRRELGMKARERILENFSLKTMIARTEAEYERLLTQVHSP